MPFKPFTPDQLAAYNTKPVAPQLGGFKPFTAEDTAKYEMMKSGGLPSFLSPSFSIPAEKPEADYFGKGLVDFGKGTFQFAGDIGNAVIDTTVKPLGEGALGVGAAGLAATKGTLGAASSLNPFDFHPEQFQERQQKGFTDPIEVFGKNYNPIRPDQNGKVDVGETLKQTGGTILQGLGGAINTASLGSSGTIGSRFIPQLIGGGALSGGESILKGDSLETAGINALIGGGLQGTLSKGLGLAENAFTKSAQKSILKPINFTQNQAGGLGDDGLGLLSTYLLKQNPSAVSGKKGLEKIVSAGKKSTGRQIENLVEAANKTGQNTGTPIEQMVVEAMNRTFQKPGLAKIKASPDQMEAAALKVKDVAQFYLKKYGTKPLDLIEQQALKTGIKASKQAYSGALDAAENVFRTNLQSVAKESIETAIPKIKNVNKLYNALREASTRMKKAGKSSGYLTNVISGTGGGVLLGGAAAADDIMKGKLDAGHILGAALIGGSLGSTAKKALTSDFVHILAGKSKNISAATLKAIKAPVSQQVTKKTTNWLSDLNAKIRSK